MRFTTFGITDLEGCPGAAQVLAQPQLLMLFAYLSLARRGGFQRRERLVGLFWPEQSEERARASLRTALSSLRAAIGEDAITRRGDSEVGVDEAFVECDAFDFEDSIKRDELAQALELYRGPFLDGLFPDSAALQHWLDGERERFRALAADAAWTLAERYESHSGDLTSATRWARRAAVLAGADERRIRRVMQLLARASDAAGAVAVFHEFERYARRELDVEPSRETIELSELIRRGGTPS